MAGKRSARPPQHQAAESKAQAKNTNATLSSGTPVSAQIDSLTIGSKEQKAQFAKFSSTILPNHNPEQPYYADLVKLRNTVEYIFVIDWLYNYRGFLKLQSEQFDVDVFEMELLNYFPKVNYFDDYENNGGNNKSSNFVDKLKVATMSVVLNSKISLANFEAIYRMWFGSETCLGGVPEKDEENEAEAEIEKENIMDIEVNLADLPKFDYLLIKDKFQILYSIISYIAQTRRFREWLTRQSSGPDMSRTDPLLVLDTSNTMAKSPTMTEYYLLFDETRLYSRTVTFTEPLVIPKKRKLTPVDPEAHYAASSFDVAQANITWTQHYSTIFELDAFLRSLRSLGLAQLKPLVTKINNPSLISHVFETEIKKRKYMAAKQKESQLAGLLAVRKRSSRIEARDRQRAEREAEQRRREEEELKAAAQIRFERRQKLKQRDIDSMAGNSSEMSRDERLKRRNELLYQRSESQGLSGTSTPRLVESPYPESRDNEIEDNKEDANTFQHEDNEGDVKQNNVLQDVSQDAEQVNGLENVQEDLQVNAQDSTSADVKLEENDATIIVDNVASNGVADGANVINNSNINNEVILPVDKEQTQSNEQTENTNESPRVVEMTEDSAAPSSSSSTTLSATSTAAAEAADKVKETLQHPSDPTQN